MRYESENYIYDLQRFQTIRSLGDSTFNGKTKISEADKKQSNILKNILELNSKANTKRKADKKKKSILFESINPFYEGWELTVNAFKNGTCLLKPSQDKWLKILTPKQMLQRLPIDLAQVKAGNA